VTLSITLRAAVVPAAAFLAVAPFPALAQLKPELQTGSMIPVQPKVVDPKDAGIVRKHFARCVYRSSRAKVAALLANSDPIDVDMAGAKIANLQRDLDMEHCLGAEVGVNQYALSMKFSPGVLRDLLAEEAYLEVNRSTPQLSETPSPVQAKFVSLGDTLARARSMVNFTDCTILKDVANADALLRTMPGSTAERTTALALAPALGSCLDKGLQVSLSPSGIRGFIAYAMWNRFGRGALR